MCNRCLRCGKKLEKPGDYCLYCGNLNSPVVAVHVNEGVAHLTFFTRDGRVVGAEKFKSYLNEYKRGSSEYAASLRFLVGKVVDEVYRKKPLRVYINCDNKEVIEEILAEIPYEKVVFKSRLDEKEFTERVSRILSLTHSLKLVEKPPETKIAGGHSTVIGGRKGLSILLKIASIPYVKKIVPGPIEASGSKSVSGGLQVRVTRVDEHGNVKLLLRVGATVQEVYVVTTAPNFQLGVKVASEIENIVKETV